jgi:formylmethanofuran dehydrogenase, subunit C (EC 1.2.99.5)
MTAGEVVVNSSCDMYTGSWMQGGRLTVNGNVGAFCGLAMKGGEFTVSAMPATTSALHIVETGGA